VAVAGFKEMFKTDGAQLGLEPGAVTGYGPYDLGSVLGNDLCPKLP